MVAIIPTPQTGVSVSNGALNTYLPAGMERFGDLELEAVGSVGVPVGSNAYIPLRLLVSSVCSE